MRAGRDKTAYFREEEKTLSRAIWEQKKQEEQDLLFRDVEEIKDLARAKMFGK